MTMRPLRILFDASTFDDLRSGASQRFVQIYSRVLASADPEIELTVIAGEEVRAELESALPGVRVLPWPAGSNRPWKRTFRSNPKLLSLAGSLGVDLLHQDVWPLASPHRTIPCVHDLRWMDRRFSTLTQHFYSHHLLPRKIRRCPFVITVSQFMRGELIRRLELPEGKIRVIPNGVETSKFAGQPSESALSSLDLKKGEYRLFIGHREPRKNLELLVRVQSSLVDSGDPLPLVIVGRKVEGYDGPERMIGDLRLGNHVRLIDSVPEETLVHLYRGAAAFLMPSLYEGFGMTVLEAMAADVPVLCTNCGPFPEIAGPRAFLEPNDVQGWTREIQKLHDPGTRDLAIAEGRCQVERFRWEDAAALQVGLYEELVRHQ